MADHGELAFVKSFLNTLSTQPVAFADDYQQPPQNSLTRVPVLPIEVPPPRKRKHDEPTSSSDSISILFKSAKPAASFVISVQPTDTVLAIKSQLASQPSAPPADRQRLLLKGKALADGKLLKEYNIKEGDTINLMVKPGFNWNPSETTPASTSSVPPVSIELEKPAGVLDADSDAQVPGRRHQRIPSVVLSPSPRSQSPMTMERPLDIKLTLDTSVIDEGFSANPLSTYHTTVANPTFWDRLHSFLRSEFSSDTDALRAFEDFLLASKGTLTASEIAKIRDQVGVVGMSGT